MCLLEREERDATRLLLARRSLAGCPSPWITQGLAERGTILMHSSNKMLISSCTALGLGVPAETTTDVSSLPRTRAPSEETDRQYEQINRRVRGCEAS